MPEKCLITGCGGFVGSHLAEYLVKHTDWDIWGLLRWSDPTDNLVNLAPMANRQERISFIYGDLRDAHSMRDVVRTVKPDYVFHLGAQSYPLTSFTAPNDTYETNIQGTANLLEALRDHARTAWIHNCSSSEVYGQVDEDDLPITEDQPFRPQSPYAISKAAADHMGQLYARAYGMRIMTTRMFTHTGARRGDVFAESSFAKQLAMCMSGQATEVRHGNLDSVRTIADVHDAVRAYHMLLTVDPQPGEVYNIGGTHTCEVGDILFDLVSLCGPRSYRMATDPARIRPADVTLQIPDCTKFKNHTGWEPEVPYQDTISGLLDYWRERVKTGTHLIR